MKRTIATCLAVASLVAMPCLAKEKRFAPLREQILSAKTVFLAGSPPDVLDKARAELEKWGRFQVVSGPENAEVVFEFRYGPTASGYWSETLTITDAKTGEVLHEDGRVDVGSGGVPAMVSAFKHCGMACEMLKDLRKRIEATEAARTFEYAIQFETRAAKYFADAAALNEKVAAAVHDQYADSMRNDAVEWRKFADQLSQSSSEMTKFLGHATSDDLLGKPARSGKEYLNKIVAYTCSTLERNRNMERKGDELHAKLSPDVVQALDAEETDEAALKADCSSEQALDLLKNQAERAKEPPPKP